VLILSFSSNLPFLPPPLSLLVPLSLPSLLSPFSSPTLSLPSIEICLPFPSLPFDTLVLPVSPFFRYAPDHLSSLFIIIFRSLFIKFFPQDGCRFLLTLMPLVPPFPSLTSSPPLPFATYTPSNCSLLHQHPIPPLFQSTLMRTFKNPYSFIAQHKCPPGFVFRKLLSKLRSSSPFLYLSFLYLCFVSHFSVSKSLFPLHYLPDAMMAPVFLWLAPSNCFFPITYLLIFLLFFPQIKVLFVL